MYRKVEDTGKYPTVEISLYNVRYLGSYFLSISHGHITPRTLRHAGDMLGVCSVHNQTNTLPARSADILLKLHNDQFSDISKSYLPMSE